MSSSKQLLAPTLDPQERNPISSQELLLDQGMSSSEDGTMAKMSPLMSLLPALSPQLMWQARQLKLARLFKKPMIGK